MKSLVQDMLGASIEGAGLTVDTNVDIVFAIDATESMQPLIDKVKSLTLSFKDELDAGLLKNKRKIRNLRVKVIVFRDFYVDDNYAMEESRFFYLPEENSEFHNYVSKIKAGGGGDEPESGLEALAVALRSDFVKDGDKRRHVIVLFTDASAHSYEQQYDGVPACYPANMFRSLNDLYQTWGSGQDALGAGRSCSPMDKEAKRMVLFAPSVYPWNSLEVELENVIRKGLDKGNGGRDLDLDDVIALVSNSIA
ncbi:MAG: VWA domain-containing protein [Oscillospiraceae bacterium]|nr:VWA domain-containing protein [Oscillospiraceae bacterium]